VSSYGIFHDLEHDVTAIGVKGVSFGEKDRFGIINCSAGGKILICIPEIEANEIRDLFTLDVYDFKLLTFLQGK
jgi:hypothetical protein